MQESPLDSIFDSRWNCELEVDFKNHDDTIYFIKIKWNLSVQLVYVQLLVLCVFV